MSSIEKLVITKQLSVSQIGKNGVLRPVALMNELQSIADNHALILGAGRDFCLAKNVTWVVTDYIIDVTEMPTDQEALTFRSWPAQHEKLYAYRDFEIFGADGRTLIRATSRWILIDLTTRRPLRLPDYLPDWDYIPERALDVKFEKLSAVESVSNVSFDVRWDDIDANQHVNNAVYVLWAMESLGKGFLDSHKLKRLAINFKKEISGSVSQVIASASILGDKTYHSICTGDTVNALVETEFAL